MIPDVYELGGRNEILVYMASKPGKISLWCYSRFGELEKRLLGVGIKDSEVCWCWASAMAAGIAKPHVLLGSPG